MLSRGEASELPSVCCEVGIVTISIRLLFAIGASQIGRTLGQVIQRIIPISMEWLATPPAPSTARMAGYGVALIIRTT